MDLNLYLGVARSVLPRSIDLGSDLALGSIPASAFLSEEMSSPPNPSDREYSPSFPPYNPSDPPYSPSFPPYNPSDPPYSPSFPPYNPSDPPIVDEEFEEPHISDSFPRMRRTLRIPDEPDELYSPTRSPPILPSWAAESSRRERSPLDLPELRFRSLIDASRRLHPMRFRSSLPAPLTPEQLMDDLINSESSAMPEASKEEDKEQKNKNAANFECNICFNLAKEPVLTSCGHLFCWPCLFRWLHVQSERKECCVCKEEVTESNIIPIYGRGCSEGSVVSENGDDPGLRIPPRPRGNRIESFRQKHRPRRFGEGIASSWRRFLSQQLRTRNSGLFGDGPNHAVLTRLRARRMVREGIDLETRSVAEETEMPRESTPLPETSDDIDLWDRFFRDRLGVASSDRLAALAADVGRAVRSGSRYRTSAAYVNPSSPELAIPRSNMPSTSAADQASASSTIAVIQGDVGTAEGPVEPNSAGSSRSYRRRGRSNTSGSLDVDEGLLHACKRRRLN